jgi:hypothetical protein
VSDGRQPLPRNVAGGYTFVLGLAALPASLAGGLLWDSVSHAAPFWFSLCS